MNRSDTILQHMPNHGNTMIRTYSSIDSTNEEAKRFTLDYAQRCLFVADEQTAGKGRLGRSFYSPNRTGLYMSLLYDTNEPLDTAVKVTTLASIAVASTLENVTTNEVFIKWVNDIYIDDKKICGILTEAIPDPQINGRSFIIVGIGINLSTDHFPDGFRHPAGSLFDHEIPTETKDMLAGQIIDRLQSLIDAPTDSSITAQAFDFYKSHSNVLHQDILVSRGDQTYSAHVDDILTDYSLLLRLEHGETQTLSSGEVSVRIQNNAERG